MADRPTSRPRRPGTLRHRLSHPSVFLFVILTAQMMVVLDTTIVNVALPHIQESLGFSTSCLSWVLNAYILTFGGLLLLGARAGDLFGRRRIFLVGIAIFTLSSLVGGLAPAGWMLLAARARPGHRGRSGRTLGALPPHHRVRRRAGAGPGHRSLHHGVGRRRGHRPGGRRAPDPAGLVALGHVRQRADRVDRLAARSARHRRDRAPPRSIRPGWAP